MAVQPLGWQLLGAIVLEAANDNIEDSLCVELMLAVADIGVASANLNFVVSDMESLVG
jgi:hypothetical protein